MGDGIYCVAGQLGTYLEDGYWDLLAFLLGDQPDGDIEHGFIAAASWHYPILTDLWRETITTRRAAPDEARQAEMVTAGTT